MRFISMSSRTRTRSFPMRANGSFTAVFHLGEASGTAYDSTANALNAEPTGEKTEEMVAYGAGAVGKARVNQTGDSSVHNRLAVPDYDSFGLGGRFTFSGWFNVLSQDGWNRLVSRKAAWGQPGRRRRRAGRAALP